MVEIRKEILKYGLSIRFALLKLVSMQSIAESRASISQEEWQEEEKTDNPPTPVLQFSIAILHCYSAWTLPVFKDLLQITPFFLPYTYLKYLESSISALQ